MCHRKDLGNGVARFHSGSGRIDSGSSPLIRLFYHRSTETHHWSGWYFLERLRGEFYDLLIDALSQHGFEPVEALAEVFDEEWRGESQVYWPVELQRVDSLGVV